LNKTKMWLQPTFRVGSFGIFSKKILKESFSRVPAVRPSKPFVVNKQSDMFEVY
jgi:hypothetical protein